ncbi:MAG TPA: amidohydrolase [Anaerolineae bacterium]|nr:amidohydrolase [Anaerolineae bacterium]
MTRAHPTEVDLLIRNGVIVPMDEGRSIIYDGVLAVDEGTILAVGSTDELEGRYTAKTTIDARQKAVLPGLINTHHHFLQNYLKGARDDLTFVDWIAQISSPLISMAVSDYLRGDSELQTRATRLGCAEALLSGITTIVNMEWATPPEIVGVYEQAGIRVVHCLYLTDVNQWDSPGMLLSVDATLTLAEQWIDRCRTSQGGRVTFRYGPACENSVSAGLFREVRRLADQNRVGIHVHVAESRFGWDNIHSLYGKTPVQYLHDLGLLGPEVLGAHCIWLSDKDMTLLKETGTAVSYNPECHMKLSLGIAPVTKMLAAGVTVSLGTDTCAVNDNMDLFEAMRVGAILQKLSTMSPAVVPAYKALEMGTIEGARALGMADRIGSLEVGKRADIILVDLRPIHMRPITNLVNNLVYCTSAAHDVDTVIVDGELLVQDRRLLVWDEGTVIAEAEAYIHHRFSEAGLEVPPYYRQIAFS